jgi:hypothetical protein
MFIFFSLRRCQFCTLRHCQVYLAATLSGLSTLTGLAVVLTGLAELLPCQAPAFRLPFSAFCFLFFSSSGASLPSSVF